MQKLKINSTMKTITYGFFIYVSLTTICGISATNPNLTTTHATLKPSVESKCHLRDTIGSSKNVEQCHFASFTGNEMLPEMTYQMSISSYLCIGISDTAYEICHSKSNVSPINSTTFDNYILKSQTLNLTKFCNMMSTAISKQRTVLTVNPNVLKLNQDLVKGCNNICWKDFLSHTGVNPLCAILLWENEILAETDVSSSQSGAQLHLKPVKPEAKQSQEKLHSGVAETAHDSVARGDESPNSQSAGTSVDKKVEIATKSTPINLKPEERKTPESSDTVAGQIEPKKQMSGKEKTEVEGELPDDGKRGGDHQPGIVEGPEDEPVFQEKPPIIKDGDTQLLNNEEDDKRVKVVEEDEDGKEDIRPDIDTDDNNGDGEEDEGLKSIDIADPLPQEKKILPNTLNPSGVQSDRDKEVHSDGHERAETNQDNASPVEHSIPHSGPPDPPQHFFAYFMAVSFICLVCYIGYHKKHKIIAIIFEGRKSRGGRGRRRPNTAGYRKLDCNLEEAVTSQCNSNVTHVIY